MTSTLWFWIAVLIVLLYVIWFIRRFIWRVIIICVVLGLLLLIWRWISPSTADWFLRWIQDLPVRAPNYVNTDILNKDIILPLHNPVETVSDKIEEWIDALSGEVSSETLDSEWNVEITVKEEEKPRYSWLSKLFKDDEAAEGEQVVVETIDDENIENSNETTWGAKQFVEKRHEGVDVRLSENWEVIIETITSDWEKIVDSVAKVWNWSWDTSKKEEVKETEKEVVKKVEKVTTTTWATEKTEKKETTVKTGTKASEKTKKEEENEVVYLKSNPKNTSKTTTTKTTTTDAKITPVKAVRWLTAAEVREANEIFN